MKKFIKRANSRVSIGSAAALLAGTSLIGTVLGILRTKLIAQNFTLFETDAYFAAFKIPDFIFFTLASGALGVAFLPVLADRLAEGNRKNAWILSSSLLNFISIVTGVASLAMLFLAPQLLRIVVNEQAFGPEKFELAVIMMRMFSLNPLLFSVSSVLTSVQQAFGRFFFYAIAPLFYNVSIIVSIFLFKDSHGIKGVGIGVIVGSLLQLLVAMVGMMGLKFKYNHGINWKNFGFRQVMHALPARSVDQGIDYINSIVETRFASRLATGSVSHYEFALTLHNAPIMLIGIAISTAAFPRFTERISQGRPDLFRKEFLEIVRAMIWIAMPVVVVTFFGRAYLARIIFGDEAPEIASVLGFLCVAIFFRTLYTIISRYFYAQKDTRTPLFVSLFVIALNIILAMQLSRPAPDGYGVVGLALAQSIVAAVEVFILVAIMLVRDHKLFNKRFWGGVVRIISVTGFSAVATLVTVGFFPLSVHDKGFTLIVKLSAIASVTVGMHILVSWIFALEEVRPIIDRGKRLVLATVRIQ